MRQTSLNYGITTTPYEPSTLSNTPMPTATDSTEQALNGLETLGANQALPSTKGKPQLRGNSILLEDIFWLTEGTKHPVHPDGVVAIVVAVSCMVNGVISSAHDWPYLAMNAVMDVCCPHSL